MQEVTGSSPVPSTTSPQTKRSGDFFRGGRYRARTARHRRRRGNKHPSGVFVSARFPTARNVYRDDCRFVVAVQDENRNEQGQGIIVAMVSCLLCYMTRLGGQSLRTCVPKGYTPLARCNTLDFVPKFVCQRAVSRLSVRSSASKCKHFEVATGDPRPLESLWCVYARTQQNGQVSYMWQ